MISTIAGREFKSLFVSPLAWIILAILQFLFAYIFLSRIELFMQYLPRLRAQDAAPGMTEIIVTGLFASAAMVMLIMPPVFCSRALAEERRTGTLMLTLSSPVSLFELVLGKFIGLGGFFLCMIALLAIMGLSLFIAGPLDLGQVFSAILALTLLTLSYIAIGLFMSSLTAQPTVAAMSTFTLLFFLWIIKWDEGNQNGFLSVYLSTQEHFNSIISGYVASVDVIYFVLLIVFFLSLTIWRLDWERS